MWNFVLIGNKNVQNGLSDMISSLFSIIASNTRSYSSMKNCKEWNCTFVYQKGMEQKVNIDSIMDTCLCATKNKNVNV